MASETIYLTGVSNPETIVLNGDSVQTTVNLTGTVGVAGPAGKDGKDGVGGTGSGGSWGQITGTLAAQSDLQTALDSKLTISAGLADIANKVAARTNLGLAIGTDVEGILPTGTTAQYLRGDKTMQDLNTVVRANRLNQLSAPLAAVNINGQTLSNVATPTNSSDAATKSYVDAVAQGQAVKGPVVAATANALPTNTYSGGVITETSSGSLTIDGVSPSVGDRVLVKDEPSAYKNGMYSVTDTGSISTPFVLTRAADMDASNEIASAYTFVTGGTVNANTGWNVATAGPYTLGTTPITFNLFSSSTIPDATTAIKGKVQLAGDLGGTASFPTTPTAVHITGTETVAGVKTFTSSPLVPVPTTSGQAASKSYVDSTTTAHGYGAYKTLGYANADVIIPPGGNVSTALNGLITSMLASGTTATIFVKAGMYIVDAPIILKSYLTILGDGQGDGGTIFQAGNGLNNDVFVTDQFATQTDHDYVGYDSAVKYMRLADFEVRGNSAGQTASGASDPAQMRALIKLYGYKIYADRLMLRDAKEVAFYTEFSNHQPTEFEQYETLPSIFNDIDIKSFGKYGFVDRGPHDSYRNRVFASASQYDTPIASVLIQMSGNYSVAGNHYNDCYGNGPSSTANILVQGYPSLTGNFYAEGSPTTAYDLQVAASRLNLQAGYSPIGIIYRGDSGGSLSRNYFTTQLIYTEPPLAYKLVGNMQSNSFHHLNENQSTASYPAPSSGGGNTVLFDTTTYAGGNNEFYGRVGGSLLFSDETKLTKSDRIDMQSDNYPDWARRSLFTFPMGGDNLKLSNDGFETGLKFKPATVTGFADWLEYDGTGLYMTNHAGQRVRLNRNNGDILVASNTAPDAWKAEADYVCTGTADDTVINPLIQAAYVGDTGGRILLSPGTFNLAAPLALYLSTTTTTPTVKLQGSGMDATYLRPTAGVHAITIGKASQAWIQDVAFELDGASDGIHDIDGLTSSDGIGWRMRHCRIENIKWSGKTTHTGWGMQLQPFRTIFSNLDGNTGRSGYTYPANGIRLFARSTPNTGATFNAGDSTMTKVQITISGLVAGSKAMWIDTDDSGATSYDASYFNQMVFQWIGLRSNVTGVGTGWQFGHTGSNKVRSILIQGADCEQFGVAFDLYNTQDLVVDSFYTSLVNTGGIYWRTDNTGTVNTSVNNWWRSAGTVGVFATTQDVIIDLNSDANNPNTYEHLFVETVTSGSARINGSLTAALPTGVLVQNITGLQRGGARHPAFNQSFAVTDGGSA